MIPTPQLSIAMCTFNGEKYVKEQVESILCQTFSDFELIICDDASTDNTFSILQDLAAKDQRIKLTRNEQNIGYNKNFEQALNLATAPLICTADQDDIWLPQKNEKLVAAMKNTNVSLAHVQSLRLENGKLNYKKRALQHHFSGHDTKRLFLFNQIMGHDAMFRRSLLQFVLPFPERMSYDWWIAVNATLHGYAHSVPEILVHHRIHENNSFFSSNKEVRKKEMDIDEILQLFTTIAQLRQADRPFLEKTLGLISAQTKDPPTFNKALFNHLIQNREIFFGHKRRKLPIISHLKYAWKYANYNFRGKGIAI